MDIDGSDSMGTIFCDEDTQHYFIGLFVNFYIYMVAMILNGPTLCSDKSG